MDLFDSLIEKTKGLLAPFSPLPLEPKPFPKAQEDPMLFQSDTAYELGASPFPGLSALFVSGTEGLVDYPALSLVGSDLPHIAKNGPYARLAFIEVDPSKMGQTKQELFQCLRRIDAVRYRIRAEGVMTRISPLAKKEALRMGKAALSQGMCFGAYGNGFLEEYLATGLVKKVSLVFITDPHFPYAELESISFQIEERTKALDHLLRDVKMDCHSCKLQPICNEVEKTIEKDFSNPS